jgi:hypothetical protein
MDARGKRILRIAIVVAVAAASGYVVQHGEPRKVRYSGMIPDPVPVDIVPLAAKGEGALDHDDAGYPPQVAPVTAIDDPVLLPGAPLGLKPQAPARLAPPVLDETSLLDQCQPVLTLAARPGAMIDLLLMAPCNPQERVVLRHGPLAVSYRTNGAGALFASVPALATDAQVSIRLASGPSASAQVSLPEADAHSRFGVQWLGPQTFQVNAFEDGADYGEPGHISAAVPGQPGRTLLAETGFLTLLGDDQVDNPMLAEIYTFPAGRNDTPIIVEAAVTDQTCGQEVLGEMLTFTGGETRVSDVSVTLPGCDAVGQYLVLKNLVPDLKIASAE